MASDNPETLAVQYSGVANFYDLFVKHAFQEQHHLSAHAGPGLQRGVHLGGGAAQKLLMQFGEFAGEHDTVL